MGARQGLLVDGHRTSYVRNAASEALRASNLLSEASGLTVPVTGIIVFVGASGIQIQGKPDGDDIDLRVVVDHQLLGVLQTRPVFSEEQVARIVSAAARPKTWHSRPATPVDGQALAQDFDALHAEITGQDERDRTIKIVLGLAIAIIPLSIVIAAALAVASLLGR